MKNRLLESSQKFSRAVIQPIMFLAVTGLVIVIGVIISAAGSEPLKYAGTFLYQLMLDGGLNQLSVIFCVGIASVMAKNKKADAAILAISSFLLFIYANNGWMKGHDMLVSAENLSGTGQAMVLGVQVVDMGVFLGILLGCITAYVFNKVSSIEFKDVFRIYGGSRLAYLVMIIVSIVLGISMAYVWPWVSGGISSITYLINKAGAFGVFLYGFLNRILIPTGLHHLIYMPFQYSSLGGTLEVAGKTYSGAMNIMMAQIANAGSCTFIDESMKFNMYGFAKIFGSIGLTLAFIKTAKPENKKRVKGLLLPSLLIAVIIGITEPLEFAFLFVSPLLWLVHSLLDGFFQMIVYVLGGRLATANGLLSAVPEMLVLPMSLTKAWVTILVGIAGIFVWYFVFVFLIKKLNLKTPGREDDNEPLGHANQEDDKSHGLGDVKDIVDGLGGPDNIVSVNNCFTRLRIDVKDIDKVDNDKINKFKNTGIIKKGGSVQIVIGMKVETVKEDICTYLHIE